MLKNTKKTIKKKTIKKITRKIIKKPAKKTIIKKPIKKKAAAKVLKPKKTKENIIGKVTHYFPHVSAAVVKVKAPLAVGDNIKIKGSSSDFTQKVESIQIDRVSISKAKKGDEIGLLVISRVREHDVVYKM